MLHDPPIRQGREGQETSNQGELPAGDINAGSFSCVQFVNQRSHTVEIMPIAWHQHGSGIIETWILETIQGDNNMTITWPEHGNNMAITWQ